MLPRARLFRLLDRARGGAVWVCGPPGAGKTTLVSSWVEARRLRCLRYRLRRSDADLASFFYELGASAGRRRAPLPLFTPEYRGGETAFARRFFRELARGRRPPWALALDDVQEVESSEPLLSALREGLEELPSGVTTFLVSRGEPPAAFARLLANGVMVRVGPDELRLTAREALAIARLHAPGMARKDLERACERAAGWAAGLVLVVSSPRQLEGGPAPPPALFQYLASELLGQADAETRRILIDAAVPPTLPVRIVSGLCGSERATRVLEDLARRACFVARRGREDPAFELHPLAREFLLARGRAEREPEEVRCIEARAAALLEEEGHVEDAIDLHARAEAWEEVARLALARAPHLVATGRTAKLEGWLEALPAGLEERHPWVPYWRGACRFSSDPAVARAHLERAWAGFAAAGDANGLHLAFAAAIESFAYEWADMHGMDRWIDRFEAAAGLHAPPHADVARRSALAMFAALTLRRLGSEVLPDWEGCALQVVEDASLPAATRLGMGAYLVLECAFRGEGTRAARAVRALAPLARGDGVDPATATTWLSAEAVHLWHAGAPSQADQAARLGLEIAQASGVHARDFHLRQQRVLAALAAGDPAAARVHKAALEAALPVRRLPHVLCLHEMDALIALHEGDAARAEVAAREVARVASGTGITFAEVLASVYVALALVEAGDAARARPHLEAVRRGGLAARSALAEMIAETAEAELERRGGDLGRARRHLERGLRVSREKGIALDIWFSRGRLAGLCALALELGVEGEHVTGLVRRLDLIAPASCHSESWPWPLRLRLLGEPEIAVRGEPMPVRSRAQRRPLEVLAAVIVAGEHPPAAGAIASAVWPDAEGDASHHALETALYRLRKLLGEGVVHRRDGALVLDRVRCWTDVAAFEEHLRRSAACLQRRDGGGALSSAESAVALYRGPFLPGREEPWVLAARERHRLHLRRCLADLDRLGADREAVRRLRVRAKGADAELGGTSSETDDA